MKYKKVMTIIAIVLVSLLSIMQLLYLLILLPKNYYYIYEGIFYIINIIVSILIILLIPFYKKKSVLLATLIITPIIVTYSVAMVVQIEQQIISFAPNGSAVLVLKEDSKTHQMTIYKNQKLWFVQKKEQFPYPVGERIDYQWLANDICAVTYESLEDKKPHQYVATYGVRGNGISLDNVAQAIEGTWILDDDNRTDWNIRATLGSIEITNGSYTANMNQEILFDLVL